MIINKYNIEPSSVVSLLKKSGYKSVYLFFDHMAEDRYKRLFIRLKLDTKKLQNQGYLPYGKKKKLGRVYSQ